MRTIQLIFVLGAITFAHMIQAQYILTLHCSEMDPYVGNAFAVRVTESGSGKEVGRKTISTIEGANFSMDLYVLLHHRSYNVDFYVDVNGNSAYDAPPADHAWRRTVNHAVQNTVINFTRDENYTSITFPDPFPYSNYDAVWGGKWMNLTFGSTDSIESSLNLTCDSIFGSFITAGIFGNPNTFEFNYADARPSDSSPGSDTIRFTLDPPWTGEVTVVDGELNAALNLMGVGLNFTGTVGAKQILALYTVIAGGNPFANGYFYLRELEVLSSSPELELEALTSQVSCSGVCDGSIELIVSGGTPPYAYVWDTGHATQSIFNLCSGIYSITVIDANGCTAVLTETIHESEAITAEIITTPPSCADSCDGTIEILAFGGTPPYSYSINGELCEGFYEVFVTDANGCVAQFDVFISSGSSPEIASIEITPATNGQADGSIAVIVIGGHPPILYSLDGGPFQPSNLFTGVPPGIHMVAAKDANGCIAEAEVVVQNLTAVVDLDKHFRWFPNPATSYLQFESDIPLSIDMLDIYGHLLRKSEDSLVHQILVADFVPGVYLMRISGETGLAYRKVVVE